VLLAGSFGRGEGTVKYTREGMKLLKDLDIWIIYDTLIECILSNKIADVISAHLPQPKQFDRYKYRTFSVDVTITTLGNINRMPDCVTYEAKHASKVLFGEDIRPCIVEFSRIPYRSGARILFQKAISLVGQLSSNFISQGVQADYLDHFRYEVSKVFVEICTALSILSGFYTPSYKSRAEKFAELYRETFPELYNELPDLAEKVLHFTKYKLDPHMELFQDPIDMWFEARDYLVKVIRYYMSRFLALNSDTQNPLYLEILRRELKRRYFQESLGWGSVYIRILMLNDKFHFILSTLRRGKFSLRRLLLSWPMIDMYVIALGLAESIRRDGSCDLSTLRYCRDLMYPEFCSSRLNWDLMRRNFLMFHDCVRSAL
jgi:hypothetical protein